MKRYIIKAHSNSETGGLRWGVYDVKLSKFTLKNFATSRLAASSAEKLNAFNRESELRK